MTVNKNKEMIENAIKIIQGESPGLSRPDAYSRLIIMGASCYDKPTMSDPNAPASKLELDEREMRLIRNCQVYAENDPAGLPGHNLAIIIAKMAEYIVFK